MAVGEPRELEIAVGQKCSIAGLPLLGDVEWRGELQRELYHQAHLLHNCHFQGYLCPYPTRVYC